MTTRKVFQNYTISALPDPLTVEEYLKQVLHYSSRKIQKLTRAKGIFVNRKASFLKRKLKENDVLKLLVLQDQSYGVLPEAGDIDILYEDEWMIILHKPPFQIVHPAGNTMGHTLANYLASYFERNHLIYTIRPVHRLDRDTSGCIAFAKSAEAQMLLETQLKARQLKRKYLAVVQGTLGDEVGVIGDPIGKDPHSPNRRIVDPSGSPACTHYRVCAANENASLLELELDTGRTHQIRVHLAHLGHPVIGDRMYGSASAAITRQALHASSLTFLHVSTNEPIIVRAPVPQDILQLLRAESLDRLTK